MHVAESCTVHAKELSTSSVRAAPEEWAAAQLLKPEQVKPFRAVAARAMFLSMDRPDIAYTAKEICRGMSSPNTVHLRMLKRLARYLKGNGRVQQKYSRQDALESRRAEYVYKWLCCGNNVIHHESVTQATVSFSSGVSEYNGLTKAAAEGLGLQTIIRELGAEIALKVYVDCAASLGMARRVGFGKVKHLKIKQLWVQALNQKHLAVCQDTQPGAWHAECVRRANQGDDQRGALASHGGDATTPNRRKGREGTKGDGRLREAEQRLTTLGAIVAVWLGWLPAADATAVKEGQKSIGSTIMLMVLWLCCAVSSWLGVQRILRGSSYRGGGGGGSYRGERGR
eukprot:6462237-Amphidinium_carterae.1